MFFYKRLSLFLIVYFCYHLKKLPLECVKYILCFDWLSLSKLKQNFLNICCAFFQTQTSNRRVNFLQLRQVIYACYSRTPATKIFCSVTQEDIRKLLQDIFQCCRNHVNYHVTDIISILMPPKSCQVLPVFTIFTKLFVRQISATFLELLKINKRKNISNQ